MLVPRSRVQTVEGTDEQLADRNFIDPDIFPGLGVSGFRGLALAGVVGSAVSLFDVRILYFILVLQWGLGKGGWERLLPHKFLIRIACLVAPITYSIRFYFP